mmetsp:Transcript_54713/g.168532  ORF Transcript_54713/g.168532 Transcript_54713/m.168532 type:complete len:214 (-) Transcript_54713:79-720(-)
MGATRRIRHVVYRRNESICCGRGRRSQQRLRSTCWRTCTPPFEEPRTVDPARKSSFPPPARSFGNSRCWRRSPSSATLSGEATAIHVTRRRRRRPEARQWRPLVRWEKRDRPRKSIRTRSRRTLSEELHSCARSAMTRPPMHAGPDAWTRQTREQRSTDTQHRPRQRVPGNREQVSPRRRSTSCEREPRPTHPDVTRRKASQTAALSLSRRKR